MINKTDYNEKKNNLKKLNENISWENINQSILEHFNDN